MTKILEAVQPALAKKGEHVVPNTTGPSFSPNSQDLRMDLSGIRLCVTLFVILGLLGCSSARIVWRWCCLGVRRLSHQQQVRGLTQKILERFWIASALRLLICIPSPRLEFQIKR